MKIEDLLFGVLTKTLNKTSDELTELIYNKPSDDNTEPTLKEEAMELILNMDSTRVENIKKTVKPDKEMLDAQYKRGLKETMINFEKELKKQYGIESDKQGIELITEIVEMNKQEAAKLTDEDVKKHPLYRSLEKERVPKADHEKVLNEFNEYKQNQTRQQTLTQIRRDALKHLMPLNPVISDNPQVAKTREEDFLNKFSGYEYEIDDDGNHLILKNGERLEDGHGNPLMFKDFVEQRARTHYEFAAQDEKGNAGNEQKSGKVTVPKSEEDYREQMAAAKSPEERIAIKAAFDAANKN